MRTGKSDFSTARHFGRNLDYGSFDRQLQRDKCRSCDLCVILCTWLHDEFLTYLAAPCSVHGAIFRKGGAFGLVSPKVSYALTVSFLGACTLQQQRIAVAFPFSLIFCKKPLCTHLLPTICSISIPRV